MENKELKTVRLSWDFVSVCIEKELKNLLGIDIKCKASASEWDYWAVRFLQRTMEITQLYQVFEKVGLTDGEAKKESLPERGEILVRSIGMQLAEKLLQKYLGYTWQQVLADEYLWLIGVDNTGFLVGGVRLESCNLPTKEELHNILTEHGANTKTLTTYYLDKPYKAFLFWDYKAPIYGGSGGVFVLVREGLVFIPYWEIDKTDGERLLLDQMINVQLNDIDKFIFNWKNRSDEFVHTMYELKAYLGLKEA